MGASRSHTAHTPSFVGSHGGSQTPSHQAVPQSPRKGSSFFRMAHSSNRRHQATDATAQASRLSRTLNSLADSPVCRCSFSLLLFVSILSSHYREDNYHSLPVLLLLVWWSLTDRSWCLNTYWLMEQLPEQTQPLNLFDLFGLVELETSWFSQWDNDFLS